MMNAAIGSRLKVIGNSSATAIDDPRPGSTPTAVPSTAPTSTQTRLMGVRAPAKPSRRSVIWSMSEDPSDEACRQVESQSRPEGDLDERGEQQSDTDVEHRPPAAQR